MTSNADTAVTGARLKKRSTPGAPPQSVISTTRNEARACLRLRGCALLAASFGLLSCSGIQSALNPQGPAAASIADLAWVMFAGAAIVFLVVVSILGYALASRPEGRRRIDATVFIVAGGVVLPVVTLSALLLYALFTQSELVAQPEDPLVVEVVGHQWWWEFRYVDGGPSNHVVTANELHIPVGRPVELRLTSRDVIHTFWVPNLAGKRDMIPGRTNTLYIEADRPGIFRGQCNEFCGAQHALMSLHVISESPQQFEQWLAGQRQPAAPPDTPFLQAGKDAFMTSGCALCHTVRGTEARGQVAPDLTHFGSRLGIAAATLRNTRGNREAWIVSSQHIKPENRMPNNPVDGETLRALAAYLGSLE